MNRLLLAAVLLVPAAAKATPVDSLRAAFEQASALTRVFVSAPARCQLPTEVRTRIEPVLQPFLVPQPVQHSRFGEELARVKLADALDRGLHLKNYTFGTRPLDLGVATDASFKNQFLAFTDGAGTALRAIGDLKKLRGEGKVIDIDANTSYRFRIEDGSIFNDPLRTSILHMEPLKGGTQYDPTTGEVLDLTRAQTTVFTINGSEYWLAYGRDVKADGSGFADTRSFLFTHIDGVFNTKAWPLAESALKADSASTVTLGDVSILLTRTSNGELIINASR